MTIALVPYATLTRTQRQALLDIQVTEAQLAFSGDIESALYTLLNRPHRDMRGFALLKSEDPCGFLLLRHATLLPDWADRDAATVHALQVDHRLQRQGLGRACLEALPRMARLTWPGIKQLQLSVDTDNHAAMSAYRASGWVDSGEAYRGRVGFERRMTFVLGE